MKASKKYAVRTMGGLAFQMPKIWKKGRGKSSLLLCPFTALSWLFCYTACNKPLYPYTSLCR